jgi:signal transduction histidine kinase
MVQARLSRTAGEPAFVWQVVLISVPVLVLAVIGFVSLRQDRAIAEHEAAERAREIAEDVLARFSFALTNASATLVEPVEGGTNPERVEFRIGPSRELLFPPPYQRDPTPAPLDVVDLAPEPARLWSEFQRLEVSGAPTPERLKACRKFVSARPLPKRFSPVTGYSMGLLLMENGEWQEAVREFEQVVSEFPEDRGESGLPLAPLCRLRLLEISRSATQALSFSTPVSVETVLRNAVLEPTLLSEYLIRRVGEEDTHAASRDLARDYHRIWDEHERTRRCYAAWRQTTDGTNVQSFWFRFGEEDLLATIMPVAWEPPATSPSDHDFQQLLRGTAKPGGSEIAVAAPAAQVDRSVTIVGQVAPGSPQVAPSLRTSSELTEPDRWVACISESELGRLFDSVVKTRKSIPDYFGLGLEVAGKRVLKFAPQVRPWHQIYYGGKTGGRTKEYLDGYRGGPQPQVVGSASTSGADSDRLKVMVFLTSPETIFQRQTARSFWFGCLIASASVAAAIGLAAAWRAFSRQHQLAEMKTNFVSSVSHELRAPIASIRLLAESLEKGKVQETQKQNDYFRFIGQECRRLTSLIENVLDFSRIEQGRKQYDFEPTDVQRLVRETVALMQTYANEKRVRIELAVAPEIGDLKEQPSLDGRAIQQALVNLIDNAVKHKPEHGRVDVRLALAERDASVTASSNASSPALSNLQVLKMAFAVALTPTRRGLDDSESSRVTPEPTQVSCLRRAGDVPRSDSGSASCFLVVSIEDHGPGIPVEEHDRIFERFYRTGSELRRESQGVGIGLSLVKHIVEAHGGSVRVRSAPGVGSTFTIQLPLNPKQKTNDE